MEKVNLSVYLLINWAAKLFPASSFLSARTECSSVFSKRLQTRRPAPKLQELIRRELRIMDAHFLPPSLLSALRSLSHPSLGLTDSSL